MKIEGRMVEQRKGIKEEGGGTGQWSNCGMKLASGLLFS